MHPYMLGVPTHPLFVALGVAVAALVFTAETRHRDAHDPRLRSIVAGALLGGAIFMRLGTWMAHLNPADNAPLLVHWTYGNRSILGGLFGAWLGVHIAKRLVGYTRRTGDLFAPAVAAGMAVGRIGCALTELPGTPTGADWGVVLDPQAAARVGAPQWAGVPLHPSFVYEIAFHAVAFVALWWWLRHRPIAPGETLTVYVAAYALFRFGVEFVRGNEVAWQGLTRPQLVLAVTLPFVAGRLVWLWWRGAFGGGPRASSATRRGRVDGSGGGPENRATVEA